VSGTLLDAVLAGSGPEGLRAIPSHCTAHPGVLRAVLRLAAEAGVPALVEATSNQVNQEGGYTGLRPGEFIDFARGLAVEAGLSPERLILGGDHLGPNPWRREPVEAAMAKAERLVADYAAAGFTKLHLDASMALGGEAHPSPEIVAGRAARLAAAAEGAAPDRAALRYVVGTEVPTPGGDVGGHALVVTRPEALAETVESHRRAFAVAGLAQAFERVIAVVVQPGVEFGAEAVDVYRPEAARALVAARPDGLAFEAHSTDYQPDAALAALAGDGFGILKVGPELTYAWREAIVALDHIEAHLLPEGERANVVAAALAAMDEEDAHWRPYHGGRPPLEERRLKLFALSDRIRYYWGVPRVERAVAHLFANLPEGRIPHTLLRQYLPEAATGIAPGQPAPAASDLAAAQAARVSAGISPPAAEAHRLQLTGEEAWLTITATCEEQDI
jgi:D-tagatose-bisphosphate aldolase class II non-catalytic subunit